MLCYHRTPASEEILRNGFRDGDGTYLTGQMHRGVWLSDRPLDVSEGAKGNDLLCMDIPEDVLVDSEWVEEGKPYREFLLPASLVNSYGPPRLVDDEDEVE
jgi:hypothetical protein